MWYEWPWTHASGNVWMRFRGNGGEKLFEYCLLRKVDAIEGVEEIDLMAVRKEREELKTQMADLEQEMDKYLAELGYE